jgi:hypothetical protein
MVEIAVGNRHMWLQIGLHILEFCRVVCHINLSSSFRDVTATVHSRCGGILVWTNGSFWKILAAWLSFFVYLISATTYIVIDIVEEKNWHKGDKHFDIDAVTFDKAESRRLSATEGTWQQHRHLSMLQLQFSINIFLLFGWIINTCHLYYEARQRRKEKAIQEQARVHSEGKAVQWEREVNDKAKLKVWEKYGIVGERDERIVLEDIYQKQLNDPIAHNSVNLLIPDDVNAIRLRAYKTERKAKALYEEAETTKALVADKNLAKQMEMALYTPSPLKVGRKAKPAHFGKEVISKVHEAQAAHLGAYAIESIIPWDSLMEGTKQPYVDEASKRDSSMVDLSDLSNMFRIQYVKKKGAKMGEFEEAKFAVRRIPPEEAVPLSIGQRVLLFAMHVVLDLGGVLQIVLLDMYALINLLLQVMAVFSWASHINGNDEYLWIWTPTFLHILHAKRMLMTILYARWEALDPHRDQGDAKLKELLLDLIAGILIWVCVLEQTSLDDWNGQYLPISSGNGSNHSGNSSGIVPSNFDDDDGDGADYTGIGDQYSFLQALYFVITTMYFLFLSSPFLFCFFGGEGWSHTFSIVAQWERRRHAQEKMVSACGPTPHLLPFLNLPICSDCDVATPKDNHRLRRFAPKLWVWTGARHGVNDSFDVHSGHHSAAAV